MEKLLCLDSQGRLYIPEKMRSLLKSNTVLVKTHDGGLLIESVEEDPVLALQRLGKKKLKGKSVTSLKKRARKSIEEHVDKKIRRY